KVSAKLDLLNIQFFRNHNPYNYSNASDSSYDNLIDYIEDYSDAVNPDYLVEPGNPVSRLIIDSVTHGCINDAQTGAIPISSEDEKGINSIEERRQTLSENNLIFASNFTYTTSTRENSVTDNTFFIFKTKIETAGNILSLFYNLSGSEDKGENGN